MYINFRPCDAYSHYPTSNMEMLPATDTSQAPPAVDVESTSQIVINTLTIAPESDLSFSADHMATSVLIQHTAQSPAAEIPWSTGIISRTKLNNICQIKFRIERPPEEDYHKLIYIMAQNMLATKPEEKSYFWRKFPWKYKKLMHRTLFRLEILKEAALHTESPPKHLQSARENLVHLDRTLDKVWEEAYDAQYTNGTMGPLWRSTYLDQWLAVEFAIQRHAPIDINTFKEKDTGNAALLQADPFSLGISPVSVLF